MKTLSIDEFIRNNSVKEIALKNYQTYVAHYKERQLQPMPLNEFLKNYIF